MTIFKMARWNLMVEAAYCFQRKWTNHHSIDVKNWPSTNRINIIKNTEPLISISTHLAQMRTTAKSEVSALVYNVTMQLILDIFFGRGSTGHQL